MNKPWFEKKKFGWGWGLPLTWQGWVTMIIFITYVASLELFVTDAKTLIPLIVAGVAVFIVIARITSGKSEWNNSKGYVFDKAWVIRLVALLASVVIIFTVTQMLYLQKAHSTFENYYHFRGCAQLLEKTDTYGICQLHSGQTIKIVQINDKWYLEGDGPGVF